MKKLIILAFLALFYDNVQSQNLYPEKFDDCKLSSFCLDCGSEKAELSATNIENLVKEFSEKTKSKLDGTLIVQILVDSTGNACLLSLDNKTNISTKKLGLQKSIKNLNISPTVDKGKPVNTSISYEFVFNNGKFGYRKLSFDFTKSTNFSSVGKPDVKGSKAKNLSVEWIVLNQSNSNIPWDMSRSAIIDKNNIVWISTDNGIAKIDNETITIFNSENSKLKPTSYNKNQTITVRHAAIDNMNNKWFIAGYDVYKYDGQEWTVFDSTNSPINWARKVVIDKNNNAWFTSWKGISKFDGKTWTTINKSNSKLPSDKSLGLFVDSQERTWIGTFEGNIRIDKNDTIEFNISDSPLKDGFISQVVEDSKNNLWFDLYAKDKSKAGIWLFDTNNNWTSIKPKNSKLFTENEVNDFLLDEETNTLWIALNSVGLIRYDIINDKWETYTPENSNVPSIHVMQLAKDKDGIIWAATFAGAIRMKKKRPTIE